MDGNMSHTVASIRANWSYSDIKQLYVHLVTKIVPGPLSLSYLTPIVLLPAALLIHPKHLSRNQAIAFFLVPIYAGVFHAWFVMQGVDVISADALLWSTYLLAYKDPKRHFKRIHASAESDDDTTHRHKDTSSKQSSSNENKFVQEPYPEDLRQRLRWVGTLIASTRMHRWKIGEASHDRYQETLPDTRTRWQFVRSTSWTIATSLLLYPFVILLAHHDPNVKSLQPEPGRRPIVVTVVQSAVPSFLLTPLLCGLCAYLLISTGFIFPAPLLAAANGALRLPPTPWSPHALPPYFGPFAAVRARGVTAVWGAWWHQHMRLMVSWPGRAAADALRLRPFAGRALRVVVAFALSGVVHAGLVPPLVEHAPALRLHVFAFFAVQAVAVVGEGGVAVAWAAMGMDRFAGRGGNGVLRGPLSAVRLVWAVVWMALTLRLLVWPFDALGWWHGWWMWPFPGIGHLLVPYTSGAWIP